MTRRLAIALRFLALFVGTLAVIVAIPRSPASRSAFASAAVQDSLDLPAKRKTQGSGANEPTPDQIASERRIAGHLHFLAHDLLGGRAGGSTEERLAALYIEAEFRKLGLEPGGPDGQWTQPFEFVRRVANGEAAVIRRVESRNVLAWLPGQDPELASEYIVLGAHYDHLGEIDGVIHRGADDNASGVAGLLEVARQLSQEDVVRQRSILFIAFGSEELGLLGAEHYVKEPTYPLDKLKAMVNLDMIGRREFLDVPMLSIPKGLAGVGGPGVAAVVGGATRLLDIARAACAEDGLACHSPSDFAFFRRFLEQQTSNRDDSAAFRAAGIPSLFLSTGIHIDYHKPTDVVSKVDPATVRRVAEAAARCLLAIDQLPADAEF